MTAARSRLRGAALAAACLFGPAAGAGAGDGSAGVEADFSGRVGVEARWHPQTAAYPGQRAGAGGFWAEPALYLDWPGGDSLVLAPYLRYDAADPGRTLADPREAYFLTWGEMGEGEWELRLGVDRVFWGVAESRHLVDIVNQTDLAAHPDGEAKLGQPMAHATFSGEWGALELFLLPFHRARTFPGRAGRPRGPLVVDNGLATRESPAGKWRVDAAARYARSLGPLDIGLSLFDGTAREPSFRLAPGGGGAPVLAPHYARIRQIGLDAQYTAGEWLLKLEAIGRAGAPDRLGAERDYAAVVAGGEYTFRSVLDSDVDLGVLAEWNHDGRGRDATTAFENDLFLGARVAFNDADGSELLAGATVDAGDGGAVLAVEFRRRLTDEVSLRLEGLAFLGVGREDPLYATRRDGFVELGLVYGF